MSNILIVEDNLLNLELMETILKHHGYAYLVAKDGESAVKIAQQEKLTLILMDLQLPDMDGFTTLEEIRKIDNQKSVPAIAVTGNTTASDNVMAHEAGFEGLLAKPFRVHELLDVLKRHVPF